MGDLWQPLLNEEKPTLKSRLYNLLPGGLKRNLEYVPARPLGRWCPEEHAGWMSRLFFLHMGPIIELGFHKSLEPDDVYDLPPWDEAVPVGKFFQEKLESTRSKEHPEGLVWLTLWRAHGRPFMVAAAWKLLHDVIMFLGPFTLEFLLRYLSIPGTPRGVLLGLTLAMFAGSVLETLTVNQYFEILYRISTHLKVGLVDMVYQKSLHISSAARGQIGVGTIVNLQSNDAAKLWLLSQYLHMVWSGPFQILVVMGLLIRVIGYLPALAGLLVICALIPISRAVGKVMARIRKELIQFTDQRVKLSTEVITGIKAIKLYAWEDPYVERITAIREQELVQIKRAALMTTFNNIIFLGGPILVSLAAFATYAALGQPLTAAVAFPALAYFNLLRFPVMMFPEQVMNIVNGSVSLKRLQTFMQAKERTIEAPLPAAQPGQAAVEVVAGNFAWAEESEPVLRNVQLSVPRGRLVMVVGAVGSGKTSLLSALLGEMHRISGEVTVRGAVAYTAQDPWIQNASLRDNVLMEQPFDVARYNAVISACAMLPDIAMLPAGDLTEIGEKGVNLSGGQRHRVALARACYANLDVYLLDDPLSAVDAHVGRQLFDQAICGLLAGRTRILCTHQVQYIAGADVVAVVRHGEIAEMGSYQELVARGVDFDQFKLELATDDVERPADGDAPATVMVIEELPPSAPAATASSSSAASTSSAASETETDDEEAALLELSDNGRGRVAWISKDGGKTSVVTRSGESFSVERSSKEVVVKVVDVENRGQLVKSEERAVGQVKRSVYAAYLGAWGPAFILPSVMIVGAILERSLQQVQSWWLSIWTNGVAREVEAGQKTRDLYYLQIYFILGMASLIFQFIRQLILVYGSTNAARKLHDNLLAKVVRLPMAFFDSQPTGRLLNRFTKDTEAVDILVCQSFNSLLTCAVSVVAALIVVAAVTPAILAAIVPLAIAYQYVQRRYIATSRELKRLDSLAFSPIFGNFSETLAGIVTLRAFSKQGMFLKKNNELLDRSNRMFWPMMQVNRWLSVRLELLGTSIVFAAALLTAVLLPRSAGLAGLAITSALNLTGLMNWMVRQSTELEVNMNGVERMVEYTALTPEKPPVVAANRPAPGWPLQGGISVEGLWVRYRPELDPVLKGLTFAINGREKVGVAGRTGCGKSTLMMTLYRIVEPCGGRIVIDGVDITQIGLFDLRSRLALVPQDPVIFSGSVRANLDPFGTSGGDGDIWEALRQAGMADTIKAMEGGLDSHISEGGGNLSTGQRQLLCMARALLRKSRILVLDEATSNVDNTTDTLIQTTIRSAFKDCTVLTIAHRLHTIIDSDRVLVLDAGSLLEFDAPGALMQDPRSAFYKLVQSTSKGVLGA